MQGQGGLRRDCLLQRAQLSGELREVGGREGGEGLGTRYQCDEGVTAVVVVVGLEESRQVVVLGLCW